MVKSKILEIIKIVFLCFVVVLIMILFSLDHVISRRKP